jgi:hypothetical protein
MVEATVQQTYFLDEHLSCGLLVTTNAQKDLCDAFLIRYGSRIVVAHHAEKFIGFLCRYPTLSQLAAATGGSMDHENVFGVFRTDPYLKKWLVLCEKQPKQHNNFDFGDNPSRVVLSERLYAKILQCIKHNLQSRILSDFHCIVSVMRNLERDTIVDVTHQLRSRCEGCARPDVVENHKCHSNERSIHNMVRQSIEHELAINFCPMYIFVYKQLLEMSHAISVKIFNDLRAEMRFLTRYSGGLPVNVRAYEKPFDRKDPEY